MLPDSFPVCKLSLFELELRCKIEHAHLSLLLGEDLIEKGEVITEEKHRSGIIDRRVLADQLIEEDGGHGSDVFVAETEIGAREAGVTVLDGGKSRMGGAFSSPPGGNAHAPISRTWGGRRPRPPCGCGGISLNHASGVTFLCQR